MLYYTLYIKNIPTVSTTYKSNVNFYYPLHIFRADLLSALNILILFVYFNLFSDTASLPCSRQKHYQYRIKLKST